MYFYKGWYIFVLEFTIHSCYGNFERDDFGTSVPFDIEFCFSFIAG